MSTVLAPPPKPPRNRAKPKAASKPLKKRPAIVDEAQVDLPLLSRARALRLREAKFWDPSDLAPCGHLSPRWAVSGLCVACATDYQESQMQPTVNGKRRTRLRRATPPIPPRSYAEPRPYRKKARHQTAGAFT